MKKNLLYITLAVLIIVITGIIIALRGESKQVVAMSEEVITVDSTLNSIQDSAYINSLQPLKAKLNEQLDVVIGHAPQPLTVHRPECEMLNWASDALLDMAIAKYDGQVDMSVVNIGGMRCEWQAGDITKRSVFELMPFDNKLVILTLTGQDILELCDIMAGQGGQGVGRTLRMEINKGKAQNVLLNNKPIDPQATYYVATSDYLSGGTDFLTPLANYSEKIDTHLLIRDLYIEYVELQTAAGKPVEGQIDQRMKVVG